LTQTEPRSSARRPVTHPVSCRPLGRACDHADIGNLPNASEDYIDDYGDRHLKVLTIGLTVRTYAVPYESCVGESGKTHDGTGDSVMIGNGCYYSYQA
jgi:hypothetical protein